MSYDWTNLKCSLFIEHCCSFVNCCFSSCCLNECCFFPFSRVPISFAFGKCHEILSWYCYLLFFFLFIFIVCKPRSFFVVLSRWVEGVINGKIMEIGKFPWSSFKYIIIFLKFIKVFNSVGTESCWLKYIVKA